MFPTTKFRPPTVGAHSIARNRVLELLQRRPLAVVVLRAPSGYGKTTAVAQWLSSEPAARTIWVSLGADDGDPVGFWSAIAAAAASAGLGLTGIDPTTGPVRTSTIVPLLDAFAESTDQWILALDDLHLITQEDTLASIDWFLGQLPENLTLTCMTRTPLELPALERLRARGSVVDLTPEHLRLGAAESREMLATVHALQLDTGELAEIHDRTAGWPAAVSLVGSALSRGLPLSLALSQRSDGSAAIGSLVREGLAGGGPGDYELLRRLSVLERFTADILSEVVQDDRAWGVVMDAAGRTGLIASLDDDGLWWRMHHLVREHLLAELGRDDPAERRELHRRAALRFERDNDLAGTMYHLLGAEDYDAVADILSNVRANSMVPRQALGLSWLDRIPQAALDRDPRLAFWEAWACATGGDEARRDRALARGRLAAADRSIDGFLGWDDVEDFVNSSACYGDVGTALRAAERFLERYEPEHPLAQLVESRRATMLYLSGRCDEALQILDRLDRGSPLARPLRLLVPAYRALCELELGDTAAAAVDVERCAAARSAYRLGQDQVYLPAEQALARWQIENGEAASGLVTAHNALRIVAQRNDTVLVVPHLLLEVCRAEVALGDLTEAAVAAAQAAELVDGAVDPGALPRRIAQVGSQLAPRDADVPHEGLSRRELEVLVLLPSELSAAEIASELFVSPNTARSHIKSIHRKLGVTSRAEAVAAARRAGLIA